MGLTPFLTAFVLFHPLLLLKFLCITIAVQPLRFAWLFATWPLQVFRWFLSWAMAFIGISDSHVRTAPLVISPARPDAASAAHLATFMEANQRALHDALAHFGAVLFRGFDCADAS